MAAHNAAVSVHKTLADGDSEDVVTLTNEWPFVEILNRGGAGNLTVRLDEPTGAELADDTTVVPPNSAVTLRNTGGRDLGARQVIAYIRGNGNDYSVQGVYDA